VTAPKANTPLELALLLVLATLWGASIKRAAIS
jgi:hypothetical protein